MEKENLIFINSDQIYEKERISSSSLQVNWSIFVLQLYMIIHEMKGKHKVSFEREP